MAETKMPDKPAEAVKLYENKRDFLASLQSQVGVLTAELKSLMEAAKVKPKDTKTPKKEEAGKEEKPEAPVFEEDPQALTILFGIGFVLNKLMNQEKLNKESVISLYDAYQNIKTMIGIYYNMWKIGSLMNYPLDKLSFIYSLKAFYTHFYINLSPKMKELMKGPSYQPQDITWISTLTVEEDAILSSMDFTNIQDRLLKGIVMSFTTMHNLFNDAAIVRSETIASKSSDLKKLDTRIKKLNSDSDAKESDAESDAKETDKETDKESDKESDKSTEELEPAKPLIPECKIGEPCVRDIGKLKEVADAFQAELNLLMKEGPVKIKDEYDAIMGALQETANESVIVQGNIKSNSEEAQGSSQLANKLQAFIDGIKNNPEVAAELKAFLEALNSFDASKIPPEEVEAHEKDMDALQALIGGTKGGKRTLRRSKKNNRKPNKKTLRRR